MHADQGLRGAGGSDQAHNGLPCRQMLQAICRMVTNRPGPDPLQDSSWTSCASEDAAGTCLTQRMLQAAASLGKNKSVVSCTRQPAKVKSRAVLHVPRGSSTMLPPVLTLNVFMGCVLPNM